MLLNIFKRFSHPCQFPGVERTVTSISLFTIKESAGLSLSARPNEEVIRD